MSTRKPKHGWQMTENQHAQFWRLWGNACEAQGWDRLLAVEREAKRREVLAALGFASAKVIDMLKGYDRVKAEFLRLAGTLDADDQQRKRLVNVAGSRLAALSELVAEGYIETLLKDRFKVIPGVRSVTDLSDKQLTQLIITVNNRIAQLSSHTVTVDTSDAPF